MHQKLSIDHIRNRAAALRLPLSELARAAGVARSTLERLRTGKTSDPHVSTIDRLTCALEQEELRARRHLAALERAREGRQLDLVDSINRGGTS